MGNRSYHIINTLIITQDTLNIILSIMFIINHQEQIVEGKEIEIYFTPNT